MVEHALQHIMIGASPSLAGQCGPSGAPLCLAVGRAASTGAMAMILECHHHQFQSTSRAAFIDPPGWQPCHLPQGPPSRLFAGLASQVHAAGCASPQGVHPCPGSPSEHPSIEPSFAIATFDQGLLGHMPAAQCVHRRLAGCGAHPATDHGRQCRQREHDVRVVVVWPWCEDTLVHLS